MHDRHWTLTPLQVLDSPEASLLIFHNAYPEGKQGGLEVIQHGERVATNGDLRLEAAPGQWAHMPSVTGREVDAAALHVNVGLEFPQTGVSYHVDTHLEGDSIRIRVDLDQPLPGEWAGKAGFNLELLPPNLFGKSYILDGACGIFPQQANGPVIDRLPGVMARGKRLEVAPEDPYRWLTIEAVRGELLLLDGRNATQNGWFIVRSLVPEGKTSGVIEWRLTIHRVDGWKRPPVILHSQVGYHPDQEKQALIELDPHAQNLEPVLLVQMLPNGVHKVVTSVLPELWGKFLRYQYARFDFSRVREPGIYQIRYGSLTSTPFKISRDVYQEGVWQPTLETFLPVQMCHVRVEDIYRVWHGACHLDDAIQAPTDHIHFDGYHQYGATDTSYQPYEHISGLDRGGWHDAGDYDLAAGSQAATTFDLALAWEAFHPENDQTTVLSNERRVILHQPDGIPDLVQQISHGAESLLTGYRAAGHSFAGIIEGTLTQYVHLGDAATMTDNQIDQTSGHGSPEGPGGDDRWAFTNKDTALEYQVAAALAAASRALAGYDDALAEECRSMAQRVWAYEHSHEPVSQPAAYVPRDIPAMETLAAVELLLTTGEEQYRSRLVELTENIAERFQFIGAVVTRVYDRIENEEFHAALRKAAAAFAEKLAQEEAASPFRLPFGPGWLRANQPGFDPFSPDYHPPLWGVGWSMQRTAVAVYYLVKAYPDLYSRESLLRVLNYVLGCHPASSTSLVSGVGARSLTVAYGVNRAEWSYTPGGIASGPALVRPDLPELMDPWPYLWQQKEYVISGASSYIFLVLAADRMLNG